MTDTKHTPGPWQNNGGQIEAPDHDLQAKHVVATVGTVNSQSRQDTANARLIAAAPALLEALELANKYLGKALADNLMGDCVMPVGRAFALVSDVLAQAREVPAHAETPAEASHEYESEDLDASIGTLNQLAKEVMEDWDTARKQGEKLASE